MVVIEAGLLGVPVISTRVGALPELFADEILFVERDGDVPSVAFARYAELIHEVHRRTHPAA